MSSLATACRSDSLFQERRRSPRIRFDCPVRWGREGRDWKGWARDAGEDGVGFTVASARAPSVGDTICVVFQLSDRYDWVVDERAVVQRCDRRDNEICEVGVRVALPDM